jgi:hypothetical protein
MPNVSWPLHKLLSAPEHGALYGLEFWAQTLAIYEST